MRFSLRPTYADDPELDELVTRLRDYLSGELADYEREHGIGRGTPLTRALLEPVWRRSRELGFYGVHLPEEFGGRGLSGRRLAALKEEIGAGGRVLGHSVLGEMGGPLRAGDIYRHATERQLEEYFLPVVRGERACCFSLTEADAGSNVTAMETVAEHRADGYSLTGHKVFSTAGTFADFAIVVASMAGADPKSFSAFIVDLDSPGCRVLEGDTPMSGENIEADIVLTDCHVPAENLLGAEGDGMRIGLGRVTVNRLLHCPTLLGMARRAIELTLHRARTRVVSGGPLISKQAISHRMADMVAEYYAARSMTYSALDSYDRGDRVPMEAFMSKLFVAESAFRILDEALQIHGKEGMVQGSEVEHLWRKVRMFRVLTGTSEIQRNGIAKFLEVMEAPQP